VVSGELGKKRGSMGSKEKNYNEEKPVTEPRRTGEGDQVGGPRYQETISQKKEKKQPIKKSGILGNLNSEQKEKKELLPAEIIYFQRGVRREYTGLR